MKNVDNFFASTTTSWKETKRDIFYGNGNGFTKSFAKAWQKQGFKVSPLSDKINVKINFRFIDATWLQLKNAISIYNSIDEDAGRTKISKNQGLDSISDIGIEPNKDTSLTGGNIPLIAQMASSVIE